MLLVSSVDELDEVTRAEACSGGGADMMAEAVPLTVTTRVRGMRAKCHRDLWNGKLPCVLLCHRVLLH